MTHLPPSHVTRMLLSKDRYTNVLLHTIQIICPLIFHLVSYTILSFKLIFNGVIHSGNVLQNRDDNTVYPINVITTWYLLNVLNTEVFSMHRLIE